MWIIALCCASLGALLGLRFKTFSLGPRSAFVVGLTAVFELLDEWGAPGLVLLTIGNLVIFQMT
jgi:hypothetical protein